MTSFAASESKGEPLSRVNGAGWITWSMASSGVPSEWSHPDGIKQSYVSVAEPCLWKMSLGDWLSLRTYCSFLPRHIRLSSAKWSCPRQQMFLVLVHRGGAWGKETGLSVPLISQSLGKLLNIHSSLCFFFFFPTEILHFLRSLCLFQMKQPRNTWSMYQLQLENGVLKLCRYFKA